MSFELTISKGIYGGNCKNSKTARGLYLLILYTVAHLDKKETVVISRNNRSPILRQQIIRLESRQVVGLDNACALMRG